MPLSRSFMPVGPSTRLAATRVQAPVSRTSAILLARRLLSNSSPRSAEIDPLVKHKHPHDHLAGPVAPRSPSLNTATYTAADEIDPYKGGPGALEKAVHLFFFTEILRGMLSFQYAVVLLTSPNEK